MNKFTKIILYAIYTIIATGACLYYLFPSDTVSRYTGHRVSEADPNITLKVDRVVPDLPPGLAFKTLDIYYGDLYVAQAERLDVAPKLTTLFKERKSFSFNASIWEGTIGGIADFPFPLRPDDVNVTADINGLMIERIQALENLPAENVTGMVNGDVAYTRNNVDETAHANLKISDLAIDLAIPIIKMALVFPSIDADISLKNRKIEIKQCTAIGEQVNGDISGTIVLADPIGDSRLNLKGGIKPHEAFANGMGKTLLTLIFRNRSGASSYQFIIGGTIDNYTFRWI